MSKQFNFTTFHLSVLTTVLECRQAMPNRWRFTNQCVQLGTPKHTPRLYPRHKQDQPTTLLSQGPGPRPNLVWCLDLHHPRLQSVGLERARTHDKRATSLPCTLNRHRQGKSVTKLCPVGRRTQPLTPTNTQTISLPGLYFPFHHFIMSDNNHLL